MELIHIIPNKLVIGMLNNSDKYALVVTDEELDITVVLETKELLALMMGISETLFRTVE